MKDVTVNLHVVGAAEHLHQLLHPAVHVAGLGLQPGPPGDGDTPGLAPLLAPLLAPPLEVCVELPNCGLVGTDGAAPLH